MQESIKTALRNTDLPMTEIAKKFKVSARTVRNINNGDSYFDKSCSYPIRITGKRLQELKRELSKATTDAVPNPHVLSPQLLDYIGFLSILEVDITCLLVFKDVYNLQLKKFFGRELSDQEILSIIELRPSRPRQLMEMIKAYDHPKVQLINTSYWLKKGIIKKGEDEILSSLLLKG